jgi:anthranilate phosphoribosyltransferase
MIREAIRKAVDGQDLAAAEAAAVFDEIMGGEATPAQIASLITALRIKGETPTEIAAGARSMRAHASRVPTSRSDLIDTCGTGGDGAGTLNISSMAALVAAGAGAAVAKHGNRSVSSQCGSADLFRELGVAIDLDPQAMGRCLDTAGIAFLFAPRLHPAMRHAIGPRREIGIRTVFNILGPLTNPAGATRSLLGVYSSDLLALVAGALSELGAEHAMVVHGHDGLDEITLSGATIVAEVRPGAETRRYELQPGDFGLDPVPTRDILGGAPAENAQRAVEILEGRPDPARHVVVANAAAALLVAGRAPDLRGGVALAQEAIDNGAALRTLQTLREVSARSAAADA